MAGSLGFRRQYCIPKGKASAGYCFADHLRSGGKALRRADRCDLSCSVYGRECLPEFFRQRVSNDTDLDDLAGQARPAGADGDGVADLVGSTQSVVIGSFLGGRSGLVSRFRRRPQPRHRRHRVPGKTQQKLAEKACSQALAAEEGISGRSCAFSRPGVPRAGQQRRNPTCGSGTGLRNCKGVGQPRGRFFHPIGDFVMDITAAAAVARQS